MRLLIVYCLGTRMLNDRPVWRRWAEYLQRWGMREFAAWFLEAIGPLNLLGAQLVYIGQPLLELFIPDGNMEAIAKILEEPKEAEAFVAYLREEKIR